MDWNKYSVCEIIVIVIVALGIIFGLDCLFFWCGMLLWNAIMPEIFGLGTITFWQAFGIKLLATLLFTPVFTTRINKIKN
ncbi:MAG: hypothetical protein IKB98_01505 [Clostridia bacterium]|nr:hypothetical protein [Clostridia bacterium]